MNRSQLSLVLMLCFLCGVLGSLVGAALQGGLPAAQAQEGDPVAPEAAPPANPVGTFQLHSYATHYGRQDGAGFAVKHGAYAVNTITGEVFHITPGETAEGTRWKMDKIEPGKAATGH